MSSLSSVSSDFESINKRLTVAHDLAQLEFEHRTVQNRCGYIACNETSGLQQCSACKIRRYCCREHQIADRATHKKFCRPPIKDEAEPEIVHPANFPLSYQKRTSDASAVVEQFLDAFHRDLYPPEYIESIFGIYKADYNAKLPYIGIDAGIGFLMYQCWRFLLAVDVDITLESREDDFMTVEEFHKNADPNQLYEGNELFEINKHITEEAIAAYNKKVVQALVDGRLPAFFKDTILQYDKLWCEWGNPQDVYVAEVKRRNFKGIKWNRVALANLAGK